MNKIIVGTIAASLSRPHPELGKFLNIQIQTSPSISPGGKTQWYIDIVVENNGGPIYPGVLSKLNHPTPKPLAQIIESNKNNSLILCTSFGINLKTSSQDQFMFSNF